MKVTIADPLIIFRYLWLFFKMNFKLKKSHLPKDKQDFCKRRKSTKKRYRNWVNDQLISYRVLLGCLFIQVISCNVWSSDHETENAGIATVSNPIYVQVTFSQEAVEAINTFYLHSKIFILLGDHNTQHEIHQWTLNTDESNEYYFECNSPISFKVKNDLSEYLRSLDTIYATLRLLLRAEQSEHIHCGQYSSQKIKIKDYHQYLDIRIDEDGSKLNFREPAVSLRSTSTPIYSR